MSISLGQLSKAVCPVRGTVIEPRHPSAVEELRRGGGGQSLALVEGGRGVELCNADAVWDSGESSKVSEFVILFLCTVLHRRRR